MWKREGEMKRGGGKVREVEGKGEGGGERKKEGNLTCWKFWQLNLRANYGWDTGHDELLQVAIARCSTINYDIFQTSTGCQKN